jgi:hypothetical protein
MRRDRRLIWFLFVSVILHGAMLLLLVDPGHRSKAPERSMVEFVLELLPEETKPPEPEIQAPADIVPVEVPPVEVTETVDQPTDVAEETAISEAVPMPEAESEIPAPSEVPRTVLNLERPSNWETLVDQAPDPAVRLRFNPGLESAVAERRGEQRRSGLLASRSAATYGVADEQYTVDRGLGETVKIGGSCYTLVRDPDVEGGQRWWSSQCVESRSDRWDLDPVEYDALGRALAD